METVGLAEEVVELVISDASFSGGYLGLLHSIVSSSVGAVGSSSGISVGEHPACFDPDQELPVLRDKTPLGIVRSSGKEACDETWKSSSFRVVESSEDGLSDADDGDRDMPWELSELWESVARLASRGRSELSDWIESAGSRTCCKEEERRLVLPSAWTD